MNDLIQSTLTDRATRTDAGAGGIDLDAVISQGRQRVRRRRLAGGAGALALLAVLGVAAPFVLGGSGDGGTQVAREPQAFAGQVSWGDGSVVRVGDRTVDLGESVRAYVLTTSGVVAVDRLGVIRFSDGQGEPVEIGVTEQDYGTLLVADGDLAAWYDEGAGAYVTYDTAAGEELRRIPVVLDQPGEPGEFEIPTVRALDGTTLWAYADQESTGFDVTTGEVVRTIPMPGYEGFQDASAGRVALNPEWSDDTPWEEQRSLVETARGDDVGTVPYGGRVGLSPDGTYAVTDHDDSETVYDLAGGEEVTPQLPDGFAFQAVGQWLSPETYQALSFTAESLVSGKDEDLEPAILRCSVASAACEVVATDVADLDRLTLPNGVGMDF